MADLFSANHLAICVLKAATHVIRGGRVPSEEGEGGAGARYAVPSEPTKSCPREDLSFSPSSTSASAVANPPCKTATCPGSPDAELTARGAPPTAATGCRASTARYSAAPPRACGRCTRTASAPCRRRRGGTSWRPRGRCSPSTPSCGTRACRDSPSRESPPLWQGTPA